MKKVGIITINDYGNYGNRLQNYAAQEVLKSLGCEVETIAIIKNQTNSQLQINPFSKISKAFKASPKELHKKVFNK